MQTTLISQISQLGNEGQVQLEVMGKYPWGKKIIKSKIRLLNMLFVAVLMFETDCCCLMGLTKYSLRICTEFDFACWKQQTVQACLGLAEARSWASSTGLCGTRHMMLLLEGSASHAAAAFTFPRNTAR